MTDVDPASKLRKKFPNMVPTKSAPTLFSLNGCGLGMYGRRDADQETGTYLKTRCLCMVFVPLIALDTFRVADAENGGWYFLGKEKLSSFARMWRLAIVIGIISLVSNLVWNSHKASPEYRMGQAREEAAKLIAEGNAMGAVDVYDGLLDEGLGDAREWRGEIRALLTEEIRSGDSGRAGKAVEFADRHQFAGGSAEPLVPDLTDLALGAAEEASGAVEGEVILASFTPESADLARVNQVRRKLLEEIHEENPEDHDVAVKLALLRESVGETEGALELLGPASESLGTGEGARLYGMLLMGEGRSAEALPHLESYVEPRLKKWRQAEKNFENEYEAGQQRVIDLLNRGQGPPGFLAKYDAASEPEQARLVDEFIAEKLLKDRAFLGARDRYEATTSVVPTIMELGIARLRVAQAESDPGRRKELLVEAEKTFLSLQSVAGESDEYRIFLGQVYYWSGRGDEGRALFDALLDDSGRKYENLYGIAEMLRDLGENEQARELIEESFGKAADADQRNSCVVLRSLLSRDLDDEIEWLKKGDASSPIIEARLAESQGRRFEEDGNVEAAAREYRKSLAVYEKQARNSAQLNNSALLYRSLHRLEGDPEDFEMAARLLSEAVTLEPNDSVLCANAAEFHLVAAVLRVVGDRIDPKIIQNNLSIDLLRYLYRDEGEKAELVGELEKDPNYRKSVRFAQSAMILAPKSPSSYAVLAGLFQYVGDEKGMAEVVERARAQTFDHSDSNEAREKFLRGENDEKLRDSFKVVEENAANLVKDVEGERARAMAMGSLALIRGYGFSYGMKVDAGSWLPELEKAAQTVPCSALDASLTGTLELIAIQELAASDSEIAEIVESARKHLDAGSVLRLLVRAKGAMGENVRKNEAVIRAREHAQASEARFPNWVTGSDWALLAGLDETGTVELVKRLNANKMEQYRVEFARLVTADNQSGTIAFELWLHLANGDRAGAEKDIEKLRNIGIKVPDLI